MKNGTIALTPSLKGHLALPVSRGPSPALVVLMEAFGITAHIRGVCERLAREGYAALAPDIYHGEVFAYTDMPSVLTKIKTIDDAAVMEEVGASLDWLAAQREVDGARLGVIGFCMGGRLAYLANIRHPERIKATAAFYGGGIAPEGADRFGRNPPIAETGAMRHPIFLGYGADDPGIGPAEHARVAQTLSEQEKRYTLAVYPGAGHGFLCEERASYDEAAATAAWREVLGFFRACLG